MTRDERQKLSVQRWLAAKGKGVLIAGTGFGKSRVGLITIKGILRKHPDRKILIVVPTITLKEQWSGLIDSWGFSFNCEIQVINTVITKNDPEPIKPEYSNQFKKLVYQLVSKNIISLNKACELLGVSAYEYNSENYNY